MKYDRLWAISAPVLSVFARRLHRSLFLGSSIIKASGLQIIALVLTFELIAHFEPAFSQPPNGYFTNVTNLGSGVNGPFNDKNSSISRDGLSLYFESNRPGSLGDDDLYMATRGSISQPFGDPIHLTEVSSPDADQAPRISADGLTLYFLSWRPLNGTTNIWVARRSSTTDASGNPQPFGEPSPVMEVNSSSFEAGPFLSFDEFTLYFISNRPGGHGADNWDIWKAERSRIVDDFGEPVPFDTPSLLDGEVNSAFHELSPHTSSDELTLFFSDWPNNPPYRPGGFGGTDIWFATRSGIADTFGSAMNLGESVNTAWDEDHSNISPEWPAHGSVLYFVSTRPGGYGGQDLWQATWLTAIAGDYNNNGLVEQADLDLVLLNWGSELIDPAVAGWLADLPTGSIDQQELDKVLLNWGTSSTAVATAGVPEPRSIGLLIFSLLSLSAISRAKR